MMSDLVSSQDEFKAMEEDKCHSESQAGMSFHPDDKIGAHQSSADESCCKMMYSTDEQEDGPPSELASYADAKKRPLSISSTSSSTSSNSSLPRQQRKRLASMANSPMANGCISSLGTVSGATSYNRLGFNEHSSYDETDDARTLNQDVSNHPMLPSSMKGMYEVMPDVTSGEEEIEEGRMQHHHDEDDAGTNGDEEDANDEGEDEDKNKRCIQRVVTEILITESVYVQDLQEIIQGYLEVLRDVGDHMKPDDVNVLFGNIEEIHYLNSMFLDKLELCNHDPVEIASCFVQENAGFAIYSEYCTNYPRAVEVLTEVMSGQKTADFFRQQQLSLGHALPIGAYLLKPVQRILKYHLLLQNILSYMSTSSPGQEVVRQALALMTKMAQHINEMKRKHETAVRIQEIQSLLIDWEGDDLTTLGDLVIEDSYRVYGAKAYRHVFLFEKIFLLAKRREDGNFIVKGSVNCSNLMLIESVPGEPLSFHVIPFDNPKMQYTLQARNLEQKRRWCLELKRLMLENYNAIIPEKAKQLVMMLGKSKDEEELSSKKKEVTPTSSGKKTHHAPQYLQKKSRRKSASTLLDFGLLKSQRGKKSTRKPGTDPPLQRRKSETGLESYDPSYFQQLYEETKNRLESEENCLAESSEQGNISSDPDESIEKSYHCDSATIITVKPSSQGQRASDRLRVPRSSRARSPNKTESFRIATQVNRVDSNTFPENIRRKYQNSTLTSSDMDDKLAMLDDGYVEVVKDSPLAKSATSGNLRSSSYQEYYNAITPKPFTKAKTMCNFRSVQHPGDYVTLPEQRKEDNVSKDVASPSCILAGQGNLDQLDNDIQCSHFGALQSFDSQELPQNSEANSASGEHLVRQSSNASGKSNLSGVQTTIEGRGCLFDMNSDYSPNLVTTVLPMSDTEDLEDYGIIPGLDPWIRRLDCKSSLARKKKLSGLYKSRSLSNLIDSREDLIQNERNSHRMSLPPNHPGAENLSLCREPLAVQRIVTKLSNHPRLNAVQDDDSQTKYRVFTRYATPPRHLMDQSRMTDQANSFEEDMVTFHNYKARKDIDYSLRDLDYYLQLPKNSSAASLKPRVTVDPRFLRSPSTPTSTLQSPSSPTSVASGDSFVDNFKNAVHNLTSLLTRKPSRSQESSPYRKATRARSFSAIEDLQINPKGSCKHKSASLDRPQSFKGLEGSIESSRSNSLDKTEVPGQKSNIVHRLARAYSDRMKKKPPLGFRTTSIVAKQLNNLLKEKRQGGSLIGERMASIKQPKEQGSFGTLPRRRKKIPAEKSDQDMEIVDHDKCDDSNVSETCSSVDKTEAREMNILDGDTYDSIINNLLTLNGIQAMNDNQRIQSPSPGPSDPLSFSDSNDDSSSLFFYEQRFVEDLEENFGEELMRDSAVYSDDGGLDSDSETAATAAQKVTIKDTVRMFEQRSRLKNVPKIKVKEVEKGFGVHEILKSLEAYSNQLGKNDFSNPDSIGSVKSIRDRTRELMECATLARIRQDTCSLADVKRFSYVEQGAAGSADDEAEGDQNRLRRSLDEELINTLVNRG